MPLNLATPPGASGQQKTDGGMPLHYEFCQRPIPIYLLHMHRTCFHNQPPPPGPDDSGPATENDNSTTEADENPSDNGEEENETTRHSSTNSSIAAKSEPVQQQQHNDADVLAKNSGGGGVNINADLQKLLSMIMELNGSSLPPAFLQLPATEGHAALR